MHRVSVNVINLNFNGLSFPLQLKEIRRFEKNNPNICINVLGYEEKEDDLIIGQIWKIVNI